MGGHIPQIRLSFEDICYLPGKLPHATPVTAATVKIKQRGVNRHDRIYWNIPQLVKVTIQVFRTWQAKLTYLILE